MTISNTIQLEDKLTPPFFKKLPVSIERGEGVHVWEEEGLALLQAAIAADAG